MSEDLETQCYISTPSGWLSLNDKVVFTLAAGSFETSQTTHRKQEVTSPFLEGTYAVNALRENITEPVSVYIKGATHSLMRSALEALKAAFDQVSFTMLIIRGGSSQTWHCYASDYEVGTRREFLHATLAQLTAQVVRAPQEDLELTETAVLPYATFGA
jgi:hypothetical protein